MCSSTAGSQPIQPSARSMDMLFFIYNFYLSIFIELFLSLNQNLNLNWQGFENPSLSYFENNLNGSVTFQKIIVGEICIFDFAVYFFVF